MSATIVMAAQQPLVGPAHPYPTKPIRLLTAATPDSGPEVIARHLAAKLTEA
jgi:tripartite-type tricarboxylate transporter receptor subunit TctC